MDSLPLPRKIKPHDFLRLCLNSKRHPPDLEQARLLAAQVEWPEVIEFAVGRYVAPALYSSLKGSRVLPGDVEQDLHSLYLDTARRNLLQANEIRNLAAEFSQAGIDWLLLKGLALAVPVYGDVGARPARDIDLLLRERDLPQAIPMLEALGYQRYDTPEHELTDLEFENEIILYRPVDGMNVDLHWSLIDSPFYQRRLDMQWFWKNSQEFSLAGTKIRSLAPEANLLYLCAHLVLHHRGDELLWSNDIAELLFRCQRELDWDMVLEKAAEFSLVLPIRQVSERLAADWQAPVPAQVLQALAAAPVTDDERRVFESQSGERLPAGKHFWSDFQDIEGWGRKLRYSLQMLFPSPQYMRRRYKIRRTWTLIFYYPYRWLLGLVSSVRGRK